MLMTATADCAGTGGAGATTWRFSLYSGSILDESKDWDIGCVVCEDGEPIAYPPFTVTIGVSATGSFTYQGTAYSTDSNTSRDTTNVANDGFYAPPCS